MPRKVPGDSIKNVEPVSGNNQSYLERILRMFRGEIEEEDLRQDEKKYLFAVRTVYGMLLECHPTPQIIGTLIRAHGYKQRQCYNIVSDTQKIFGQIQQADKDFSRMQAIEMAKYAWSLAKRREDIKGLNGAIKNFITATGLDKIDPEMPDFEKLAPSLNVLMLPEGMEDQVLNMLKKGVVDLNTIAETISYEDVPAAGAADQK